MDSLASPAFRFKFGLCRILLHSHAQISPVCRFQMVSPLRAATKATAHDIAALEFDCDVFIDTDILDVDPFKDDK